VVKVGPAHGWVLVQMVTLVQAFPRRRKKVHSKKVSRNYFIIKNKRIRSRLDKIEQKKETPPPPICKSLELEPDADFVGFAGAAVAAAAATDDTRGPGAEEGGTGGRVKFVVLLL